MNATRRRYGPGWEGRIDRVRDRRSAETAHALRKHLRSLRVPVADAFMGVLRLLEVLRLELLGDADHQRSRPQPLAGCRVWCEEPAGDGWADES